MMPTIFVIDGFTVRILPPPREHGPAHVHIWKSGTEVVITLGDRDAAPSIRRVFGMNQLDVARAHRIVAEHKDLLLQFWRQYHG